jgi:hypothetical protein
MKQEGRKKQTFAALFWVSWLPASSCVGGMRNHVRKNVAGARKRGAEPKRSGASLPTCEGGSEGEQVATFARTWLGDRSTREPRLDPEPFVSLCLCARPHR